MKSGFARKLGKWAVAGLGLLLIACGLAAMASGWDQILIERGWSLFISGATLVAGGAVTASLAAVIGRLDALGQSAIILPKKAIAPPPEVQALAESGRDHRRTEPETPPQPPVSPQPAPAQSEPAPVAGKESAAPTIIDHYEAGGASYVMYSDGSVEVRTEFGVHRYASLAELRTNMDP
jgi:hypothetical protein